MLIDELKLQYIIRQDLIKAELNNNIKSNSAFSLTLNAWTAIN
jgi:acid stress-induced BolA-like protein IbaG/YrbA